MTTPFEQFFRCPDSILDFQVEGCLSSKPGFFRFGPNAICYGRSSKGSVARNPSSSLYDAAADTRINDGLVTFPFDPSEVIENLRRERYTNGGRSQERQQLLRRIYYTLRPGLPLAVRGHLQRFHLRNWEKLGFPHWPVDTTVDSLMQQFVALALRSKGVLSVPFIWFWPDGAPACSIMTHDVETERGRQFCGELMEIDSSFKVPSSFQIVPEERYSVDSSFLHSITDAGFEVNVHDLNHDCRLFEDRRIFERRVKEINRYGREFGASGFRSAVLYRNQEWYDSLDFEYDMSVPNVAHLDPQRGGCCTVMPYFVHGLVELPVTATQDHSLFNVFGDFSTRLWETQISAILERNGLISFITHPDYLISRRAQETYKALLSILGRLRAETNVWMALPRDVNRWWRQRDQMSLTYIGGKWSVEGPGSERAKVAFATITDNRLTYTFDESTHNNGVSNCQFSSPRC